LYVTIHYYAPLYCSTTLAQAAIRGSDSHESALADVWSDYVEARHQLSGMATAAVIDSSTAYEPRGIFEVTRNNEAAAETQQQYKDKRVQRPVREHRGAASRKTAIDTNTETTGPDVHVHEGHTTRAPLGAIGASNRDQTGAPKDLLPVSARVANNSIIRSETEACTARAVVAKPSGVAGSNESGDLEAQAGRHATLLQSDTRRSLQEPGSVSATVRAAFQQRQGAEPEKSLRCSSSR
jgi:hypothetical protein